MMLEFSSRTQKLVNDIKFCAAAMLFIILGCTHISDYGTYYPQIPATSYRFVSEILNPQNPQFVSAESADLYPQNQVN